MVVLNDEIRLRIQDEEIRYLVNPHEDGVLVDANEERDGSDNDEIYEDDTNCYDIVCDILFLVVIVVYFVVRICF